MAVMTQIIQTLFPRRPRGTAGPFSCRSISVSLRTAAGKMFIAMAFIGTPLVRPVLPQVKMTPWSKKGAIRCLITRDTGGGGVLARKRPSGRSP